MPINIKIGEMGERRYLFNQKIQHSPFFNQIMMLIRPHEHFSNSSHQQLKQITEKNKTKEQEA
jgi:hypothetical protein